MLDKDKILSTQLRSFVASNVYGAIILDPRKNKKGLYNVRHRLTYAGDRKYIPGGYAYSLKDWERITSNTVKDKQLKAEKTAILNRFREIESAVNDITGIDGKAFSFELLYRKIAKGDKTDVFLAFDEKITRLMTEGRVGTALSYSNTLGSIWVFFNDYKGKTPFSKLYASGDWLNKQYKRLIFDNITEDFIKRYKKYLKDAGRSDATAGIYLRTLRAILNENDVPLSRYPFGKGKQSIPASTSRKIALSKDVIGLIAVHPLNGNPKMYRDLWLFSYLCNGANLKDIFRLKQKNLQGGFIYFRRAKTERTSKLPLEIKVSLHPEMKRIITDWGNPVNGKDEFLFTYLQSGLTPTHEKTIIADYTKRINLTMNRIGKSLGIEANITLYCARHSFAVNSERSGQRTSLIAQALGHSDIATTVAYLGSFDDSEIVENANKLL